MKPISNLVFEGGGISGVAYGGALVLMEKYNLLKDVVNVGGTSAGAITACLLAIGYSACEIQAIIKKTKFSSFQDDSFGVIRDSLRLINDFGWHKGETFKKWLGDHIAGRFSYPNVSFADLARRVENGKVDAKYLYVIGTNLSKQRAEIYSHETTPDMLIVDAVRISMGIPFFFQCVRNKAGDILVDGGVANNFPIRLFDPTSIVTGKTEANPETLGFRLDTPDEIIANGDHWENASVKIEDFGSYISAVLSYLMEMANKRHLTECDRDRTIFIDKAHIKATDFDLTDEDIALLTKNGESAVRTFFKLDNEPVIR